MDLDLPEVLPVTYNTQHALNTIALPDLSQHISATKSSIQESLTSLISLDAYPEEAISQLAASYKKLLQMESYHRHLDISLKQFKHTFVQQSNNLPTFDKEHWTDYTNNSFDLINIKEKWSEAQKDEIATVKNEQWLRVFHALRYIWNDPTCVLPEDTLDGDGNEEEDDDVKVDGGVIQLHCPVSFKKYSHPMISTKCKHTFDSTSLESLFNNHRSIECPMPGCGNTLTRQDFVDDRLMQFRILISDLRKPNEMYQATAV